jgi:hypothetical protein
MVNLHNLPVSLNSLPEIIVGSFALISRNSSLLESRESGKAKDLG